MSITSPHHNLKCDLLIVGSGAARLIATITAAASGLDVIIAEKSELIDGATA
ncbi:FAD-binding protein [Kiloniella spongiae]|uniref:FAD-binding protein n=1 Tax=Kiloniella spongiae TaxID=1489064 RepID=UPI0012E02BBD|nr:FAD-binding protein [Kiloniella spongiae]